MKLLRLTGHDGQPFYINPDHIVSVYEDYGTDSLTRIELTGQDNVLSVKHPMVEIFNMLRRLAYEEERDETT